MNRIYPVVGRIYPFVDRIYPFVNRLYPVVGRIYPFVDLLSADAPRRPTTLTTARMGADLSGHDA